MPIENPLQRLTDLGFQPAGRYDGQRFLIEPDWRGRQAVYAWLDADHPGLAIRFGIACGPSALSRRYASYNRWLTGRFKPDNAREQEKAALFRQRLRDGIEVVALPVADKASALSIEYSLRSIWGAALDLDGMAKGSWVRRKMAESTASGAARRPAGRSVRLGQSAIPQQPALMSERERTPPGEGTPMNVSPVVRGLFTRLDRELVALGLTPQLLARNGVSYRWGGDTLVRIDPKAEYLRIRVAEPFAAHAPQSLRASSNRPEWLIAYPQDANLAVEFITKCARESLSRR